MLLKTSTVLCLVLICLYQDMITCMKIIDIPRLNEGEVYNITIPKVPSNNSCGISICWWFKTRFDRWFMHFESQGLFTIYIEDRGKESEE